MNLFLAHTAFVQNIKRSFMSEIWFRVRSIGLKTDSLIFMPTNNSSGQREDAYRKSNGIRRRNWDRKHNGASRLGRYRGMCAFSD